MKNTIIKSLAIIGIFTSAFCTNGMDRGSIMEQRAADNRIQTCCSSIDNKLNALLAQPLAVDNQLIQELQWISDNIMDTINLQIAFLESRLLMVPSLDQKIQADINNDRTSKQNLTNELAAVKQHANAANIIKFSETAFAEVKRINQEIKNLDKSIIDRLTENGSTTANSSTLELNSLTAQKREEAAKVIDYLEELEEDLDAALGK